MKENNHIEIHEVEPGSFVVKNTKNSRYVKMGAREVSFLRTLMELDEISSEVTDQIEKYCSDALTKEQALYMVEKFQSWGFLPGGVEEVPKKSKMDMIKSFSKIDITAIKFFTVDPDRFLDRIQPVIKILCHPFTVLVYLVIITIGFSVIRSMNFDMGLLLTFENLRWSDLGILYVAMFLTTIVHEFSHAMSCKYYGGKVKRLGFMLFYLQPAMFCDITDSHLFKSKKAKVMVSFAGILSTLLLTSLALLVFAWTEVPQALYYAILNIGLCALNLIPFVKLDGYWILTHLTNINNLRDKSFKYLFAMLSKGGRALNKRYSRSQKISLLAYGITTSLFTPVFWGGGVYQVSNYLEKYLGGIGEWIGYSLIFLLVVHFVRFLLQNIRQVKDDNALSTTIQ